MDATLYKELSDAQEVVQIEAGKSIRDNFPGLDLSKRIILVNGIETSQDYIAQVGDIIMIRSVPHAITTVAIIALAVVVTVGAVVGGVALYKMKKQLDELQNSLKNVNESVRNIPYLRGAQNALATGNSQPYIIGEHLFTPYLIAGTYSKLAGTDGADQYFYAVLENGFNKQVIRNLKCDDVILKDWGGALTTPQEGIFTFDTSSVFYDANSLIEVAQDGNAFATAEFNKKVFESSPGTQLLKADNPDYEDLIFTLPDKSRSAEVCILINGLMAYNDNGNKINRTVTVIPEYQLVDEGAWTAFTFDQNGTPLNEFTRNVINQLRFVARVDFTYAQVGSLTAPVKIRLRCTTDAYDGSVRDDVYVQWIQSEIYDPIASATLDDFVDEPILGATERAVSTLVGLKIKVTASNEEKLKKINCVTSGVARTWNGLVWSEGKVPTSNPAAWLLEVLTSHTHKASQADDSEIDLDSLGELYDYCETNELNIDMVLVEGDTKESVLARILETCFSVLYRDIYGQISVAIDSPKANAIALFNTQNVISFENTKSLNRRTDGIKISYVSRDAGYVQSSYLIMRSGFTRNADSILRDVSVSGIVEYEHIVKYARRLMAIEALRPKTVSVQVGKEGIYYTPLSKVLIQHPSLKVGIGSAEIKYVIDNGAYITGLVLYEPAAYDPDNVNGFGAVIAAVGDDYYTPLAVAYTADENSPVEIELVTPIAVTAPVIPHAGDVLSYGLLSSGTFDTITTPMLIAGVTPNDQGHTLQLIDYNSAVYDVGDIPEYVPNFTLYTAPGSIPDTVIPEGFPGVPGYRTATMTLYKWLSSPPSGSWPTGSSTYTWATGEWTEPATLNGWAKNPSSPNAGDRLFAIDVIIINNNADAESSGTWGETWRVVSASLPTVFGMLTNDFAGIPTDVNGDNGNYVKAKTKLVVYEGTTDVTSEFTPGFTADPSGSITFVRLDDDGEEDVNGRTVHVTNMAVDTGEIICSGVRLGTTITKRFVIYKAKQGDQAPVYSMAASSLVVLVKPDMSRNPQELTFTATSQVGLAAPQEYDGIFKFYANDNLLAQSAIPQHEYTWDGFGDILLYADSEILIDDTSEILLPFDYNGEIDLAYMRVELWDESNEVLLDRQTVVFIADWENYKDEMLEAVPDFTPRYLGRFNADFPSTYRKGDTWLVYDTDNSPYTRGVYFYNGVDAPYRLTDAASSQGKYIVEALPDILWAVKNSFGTTADYGAVTYIENLVSNAIFTDSLQVGQGNVTGLDTTLSALGAAAAADAEAKADAAQSAAEATAAADATSKAATAESNAKAASRPVSWVPGWNDVTGKPTFGSLAYDSVVELAKLGSTIIEGGYIKTDLIEAVAIIAQAILAGAGVFDDLQADNATFTNATVTGKANVSELVYSDYGPGNIVLKKVRDLIPNPNVTETIYSHIQICGSGTVRITFELSHGGIYINTFYIRRIPLDPAGSTDVVFSQALSGSVDWTEHSIDVNITEGDTLRFEADSMTAGLGDGSIRARFIKIKIDRAPGILSWIGYESQTSTPPVNPR